MGDGDDMLSAAESAADCYGLVTAIFPTICPDFLHKLAGDLSHDANAIINHIADEEDQGKPYPRKPRSKALKRKRGAVDDEAQEVARVTRIYDGPGRQPRHLSHRQVCHIRGLLSIDFPQTPLQAIDATLETAGNFLLPAYVALWEAASQDRRHGSHAPLAVAPCAQGPYAPKNLDKTIQNWPDDSERETLLELQAARRTVASRELERRTQYDKEEAERRNFAEALADGFTKECECCFGDFAFNRLAHCSAETAHWFCFQCCRSQAETLVGLSKYELTCMSTDGCSGSFSHLQRRRFLDDNLSSALDRAEQDAMLRLANLENLVSCPFCPFAAECAPADEDREFRCQNPECQIVSCRLCSKETHVPHTCEEAAKEHGFSARRTIEEAMSAALIRRCNKCNTPFIKEDGCNKMMCTRAACRNVQCYICSKSCDYSHFNDPSRGGQVGNCPLFDVSVEARHAEEINRAEKETRKKVIDANPDMDLEHLRFHMSGDVAGDDERRARGADGEDVMLQEAHQQFAGPDRRAAARLANVREPRAQAVNKAARAPRAADNAADQAAQGRLMRPGYYARMHAEMAQGAVLPPSPPNHPQSRDKVNRVAVQQPAQAGRAVMAGGRVAGAPQGAGMPPVLSFGLDPMGARVGVNQHNQLVQPVQDPRGGGRAHQAGLPPVGWPANAQALFPFPQDLGSVRGRLHQRQKPGVGSGAGVGFVAPPLGLADPAPNLALAEKAAAPQPGHNTDQMWPLAQEQLQVPGMLPFDLMDNQDPGNAPRFYQPDDFLFL